MPEQATKPLYIKAFTGLLRKSAQEKVYINQRLKISSTLDYH
jgi:hypothetical protein